MAAHSVLGSATEKKKGVLHVLLSTALDEAGHTSANTLTKFVFEEVTDDLYIECQKCGAKNCAELVTGPDGSPRVRITHVRPD